MVMGPAFILCRQRSELQQRITKGKKLASKCILYGFKTSIKMYVYFGQKSVHSHQHKFSLHRCTGNLFKPDKNLFTATNISFLWRGVPATGLNRFLVIGWPTIARHMINRPMKQPKPGKTLQKLTRNEGTSGTER
jgi:hypothetical protein